MSETTNQDQSKSNCHANFVFDKILNCTYYYDFFATRTLPNSLIDYKQAMVLLKSGKLIDYIKPKQKITKLTIHIRNHQKELVEYIINNLIADCIQINIEIDIEINFSLIKSVNYVEIYDYEGYLPPEYLHHLVKLLENGQTRSIVLYYNSNKSLEEDLAEFDGIIVHITTPRAAITSYLIELKR